MDYRITKIRTKDGQMGTPVGTTLDEIVTRMQSDKYTREVDQVAKRVTYALIDQQEKGWKTYHIEGIDELPYLIFSSTFSRQGLQDFRQPTGLVLLSVDYGMDLQRMKAIRDMAIQLPQTVLVFRSVSRRRLKIVVRCQPKDGQMPETAVDYEAFLSDAQQQAAKYYGAFCDCEIALRQESLQRGCRMSQDSELYYQPDAEPLTIIRKDRSPLAAYPNAVTDHMGWTSSDPTKEQQDKERADFYACRRKAHEDYKPESDDPSIQEDGEMTLLAQYCRRSALPMEASVIRAARYASHINIEDIRSIFKSVYEKTLSNIKEVKARDAVVIGIAASTDTELEKYADHVIKVPDTDEMLIPLLAVVPLQLLAYYAAITRGCDVDKPRNLAKSVTVE